MKSRLLVVAAGTVYYPVFFYTIGDNQIYTGTGTLSQPAAAPEIDPAMAVSAMSLLLGGLAVLRGRRCRS